MTVFNRFNWDEWVDRCAALLKSNQITSSGYRYTRPAPHTYEQQWLWDSCFHAVAYRWFDRGMAQDELRSVIAYQLTEGDEAGMIPHMTYWQGDAGVMWGATHTSRITQPPLIAVAALRVHDHTHDDAFLREIYPAVAAYHRWFDRRRTLNNDSLVRIIHPWETGWDASPRWDRAMGLDNPTDDDSKNARHALVKTLDAHDYSLEWIRAIDSFSAIPADLNAIRAADLEALAEIAKRIGKPEQAAAHRSQAQSVQAAVRQHIWLDGGGNDRLGSDEVISSEPSAARFVLLFGGCLTDEEAHTLLSELVSSDYNPMYPIPTTPLSHPRFDGDHYWRGNVWLAVNWLIISGLRRYGFEQAASHIAQRSLALVAQSGFFEYFNPITGAGHGPDQQSWSTIVLDMLAVEIGQTPT